MASRRAAPVSAEKSALYAKKPFKVPRDAFVADPSISPTMESLGLERYMVSKLIFFISVFKSRFENVGFILNTCIVEI